MNNPVNANDPSGLYTSWYTSYMEHYMQGVRMRSLFDDEDYSNWEKAMNRMRGPGSGNYWSDQYRSMKMNFGLMSTSNFESFYGVDLNDPDDVAKVAQGIGGPGYLVTTDEGNYIYGDKSFQTDFAGGGMENWYRAVDLGVQNGGGDDSDPFGLMADILRNVPFFGINGGSNPFYGAEAIYLDGGGSFVGAEKDGGVFFILAGKEKGTFKTYSEIAGGGATDAGLGIEIGRVDIDGNPEDFTSEYLYGIRDKVWLSVSPLGEVISAGGAYSWSSFNGRSVYSSSVQIGIGVSPIPFLSGGYNHGRIK